MCELLWVFLSLLDKYYTSMSDVWVIMGIFSTVWYTFKNNSIRKFRLKFGLKYLALLVLHILEIRK